jgi:hypothetical protein
MTRKVTDGYWFCFLHKSNCTCFYCTSFFIWNNILTILLVLGVSITCLKKKFSKKTKESFNLDESIGVARVIRTGMTSAALMTAGLGINTGFGLNEASYSEIIAMAFRAACFFVNLFSSESYDSSEDGEIFVVRHANSCFCHACVPGYAPGLREDHDMHERICRTPVSHKRRFLYPKGTAMKMEKGTVKPLTEDIWVNSDYCNCNTCMAEVEDEPLEELTFLNKILNSWKSAKLKWKSFLNNVRREQRKIILVSVIYGVGFAAGYVLYCRNRGKKVQKIDEKDVEKVIKESGDLSPKAITPVQMAISNIRELAASENAQPLQPIPESTPEGGIISIQARPRPSGEPIIKMVIKTKEEIPRPPPVAMETKEAVPVVESEKTAAEPVKEGVVHLIADVLGVKPTGAGTLANGCYHKNCPKSVEVANDWRKDCNYACGGLECCHFANCSANPLRSSPPLPPIPVLESREMSSHDTKQIKAVKMAETMPTIEPVQKWLNNACSCSTNVCSCEVAKIRSTVKMLQKQVKEAWKPNKRNKGKKRWWEDVSPTGAKPEQEHDTNYDDQPLDDDEFIEDQEDKERQAQLKADQQHDDREERKRREREERDRIQKEQVDERKKRGDINWADDASDSESPRGENPQRSTGPREKRGRMVKDAVTVKPLPVPAPVPEAVLLRKTNKAKAEALERGPKLHFDYPNGEHKSFGRVLFELKDMAKKMHYKIEPAVLNSFVSELSPGPLKTVKTPQEKTEANKALREQKKVKKHAKEAIVAGSAITQFKPLLPCVVEFYVLQPGEADKAGQLVGHGTSNPFGVITPHHVITSCLNVPFSRTKLVCDGQSIIINTKDLVVRTPENLSGCPPVYLGKDLCVVNMPVGGTFPTLKKKHYEQIKAGMRIFVFAGHLGLSFGTVREISDKLAQHNASTISGFSGGIILIEGGGIGGFHDQAVGNGFNAATDSYEFVEFCFAKVSPLK